MFSNQVNSRDLFYSNPIDHFLVQDATQKISRESGFSSSFSRNQSGNSKDLYQYSGSEDLFSHTENSNMYDSQPASHKLDYQKYISQNLILGKINKSPETTSVNKQTADKDLKKNSNFRACLSDTEFINQSEMKEIRDFFRSLTAVIQKLNVDVLIVKDNVKDIKDEISRQNENFESFKDILGKQERKLNEVEISLEKCNQKQDEYYADLKCIARGTNENVENVIVEVRDGIQCGNKVSESIKKILSAHENSHKKFLCDAKNQNKSIIRSVENTTCKIQSAIEAIPKNLNKFVDKFEQKTKELQTAICAVKETAERNISTQSVLVSKFHDEGKVVFNSSEGSVKEPGFRNMFPQENNSYVNTSRRNFKINENKMLFFPTEKTVHTPLAVVIDRYKNLNVNKMINEYQTEIPENNPSTPYKAKLRYTTRQTSLRIRRKSSTPLLDNCYSGNRKIRNSERNVFKASTVNNICNIKQRDYEVGYSAKSCTSTPTLDIFEEKSKPSWCDFL